KNNLEAGLDELLGVNINHIQIHTLNDSIHQLYLELGGVDQSDISTYPSVRILENDLKSIIEIYRDKYGNYKTDSMKNKIVTSWDFANHRIEITSLTSTYRYYVAVPGYEQELRTLIERMNAAPERHENDK